MFFVVVFFFNCMILPTLPWRYSHSEKALTSILRTNDWRYLISSCTFEPVCLFHCAKPLLRICCCLVEFASLSHLGLPVTWVGALERHARTHTWNDWHSLPPLPSCLSGKTKHVTLENELNIEIVGVVRAVSKHACTHAYTSHLTFRLISVNWENMSDQ